MFIPESGDYYKEPLKLSRQIFGETLYFSLNSLLNKEWLTKPHSHDICSILNILLFSNNSRAAFKRIVLITSITDVPCSLKALSRLALEQRSILDIESGDSSCWAKFCLIYDFAPSKI